MFMRIEVLQARKGVTPDLETRMDRLIHPEIGDPRLARTRFHALAVMFYIDGMEDLKQLSEIAQAKDRGIKKEIGSSFGGYWELTTQEQRWFKLAQAGVALGIGMRALERIVYEQKYNPLQIREWYNAPLRGTLIRKIPIEEPTDREAFIESTSVPDEIWEVVKKEHQKDETGASMFDLGFEKLPEDLKNFITSLGVMRELKKDTLPAFRRITAEEPRPNTPVPEVFRKAWTEIS